MVAIATGSSLAPAVRFTVTRSPLPGSRWPTPGGRTAGYPDGRSGPGEGPAGLQQGLEAGQDQRPAAADALQHLAARLEVAVRDRQLDLRPGRLMLFEDCLL